MVFCNITQENFWDELAKLNNSPDIDQLKRAVDFASQAHQGQKRDSGEDYIIHPLNTAYILAKLNMDTSVIIAGLLHDVIEDTQHDHQSVCELFGERVAGLVEGVTKISDLHFEGSSHMDKQAENFRKLLVSITKDVRVILIKLADRLHNMRTINYLPAAKQKRIARSTLSIYAPLANRFGLSWIKNELEDRCLKVLHPSSYQRIAALVQIKKEQRDKFLNEVVCKQIDQQLQKYNIKAKVLSRSKHFYSIFRKNSVRGVPYEEILDLNAVRILVDKQEECYYAFGALHAVYKPLNIVKDYIANPKPNGYQSLHTVVIGPQNKKLEVQIRTHNMDKYAEEGVAAHWRYKERTNYSNKNLERAASQGVSQEFESQLGFVRKFLQNNAEQVSDDFLDNLQMDLYPEIIIVTTPKGDLIELPKGACILDFAFFIHTQVGSCCLSGKVNGVIKPLRTKLKTGDKVEVETSNKINISKNWLKYVKSSKARSKIRSHLKKRRLEDAIELGKEIFVKKCRKFHLKFDSEQEVIDLAKKFHFSNAQDFYAHLGQGNIIFDQIIQKMRSTTPESKKKIPEKKKESLTDKISGVIVDGQKNLMIKYAGCCTPLPGDKIIGFVTKGRGIIVHRQDCHEPNFLLKQEQMPERFISIDWDYSSGKSTGKGNINRLKIVCKNKSNILIDILSIIAKYDLSVEKTGSKLRKDHNLEITLFLVTSTPQSLNKAIAEIEKLGTVRSVERKIRRF